MKYFTHLLTICILAACGGGGDGGSAPANVVSSYSLGGSIAGLGGASGLTLVNGTETISVNANATVFTFVNKLTQGASYSITVSGQPVGLKCSVSDGAGTMAGADVKTVAVKCLSSSPTLAPFAGNPGGLGSVDGMGAAASFGNVQGIATDSSGNIYVADYGNNTIRKITQAGVVSTLAGTAFVIGHADGTGPAASFEHPQSIAADSAGNVYVTERGNPSPRLGYYIKTVRKITPDGVVSTLASLYEPHGLVTDTVGNVYATDGDNTIKKITPAGTVSILAGTAKVGGSTDGVGAAARFNQPYGIARDKEGNLYVADAGNSTIRKITPAGVVNTLAGTAGVSGSADGMGTTASFTSPLGITIDSVGNVYVVDADKHTIRKITPTGMVSTLPGSRTASSYADGSLVPASIASDGADNIYVDDADSILKIAPSGTTSTLAGTPYISGSADGIGAAASFNDPNDIALDSAGNVYVVENWNNLIRKITPGGVVSTLAGAAHVSDYVNGVGAAASFGEPHGIAIDAAGNLYTTDVNTIRKITPSGVVSTLAGTARVFGHADGVGPAARFDSLSGIAIDSTGNLYVTETYKASIRKITPAGVVSTLIGGTPEEGAAAGLEYPRQITIDSAGNLYVIDGNYSTVIRKITPLGVVSTLAGKSGIQGHTDATGAEASFGGLAGIAVDSGGTLYVSDLGNSTIRKITSAGVVSTLVGVTQRQGFVAGALPGGLRRPKGLAIQGTTLYVSLSNGVAVVTNLP